MSKKIVLKVELNCDKCKQKAMETIAGIEGVESLQADMKEQKITVIGDADPVSITKKLRKLGQSEIVSVGPSKEPEKKPADKPPKKEEPSKPSAAPNITYVYLPRYWDSCHCGHYWDSCHCGHYCY